MQITHSSLNISMAHEHLDRPQIGARLKQMRSKAMSKRMRGDVLDDASPPGSFLHRIPDDFRR